MRGFYLQMKRIFIYCSFCLDSTPNSEIDLLMDKSGGDTRANDDVEAGGQNKSHKRRQILYNIFDFLAIVTSI